MDTHTLVVMNVLLYVLYAGVIVMNARITGISKGSAWFAGSNLTRGVALLLLATGGQRSGPLQMSVAVGYLISVSGVMMLHFSFTELLERGPLLRWLQYLLLGTMAIGTVYLLLTPSMHAVGLLVMCAVEGVQIIATASVVFLFREKRLAWRRG